MLVLDFTAGPRPEARWLWDGRPLGPAINIDGAILHCMDKVRTAFAQPFVDRILKQGQFCALGRSHFELPSGANVA